MLYSKNPSLEDRVIELLMDKETTVRDLHEAVLSRQEEDVTIQAIYKIINNLIDDGVVIKVGKYVTISREWSGKTAGKLGLASVPLIKERESVVYNFTSFSHLDLYWKTLTLQLQHVDEKFPGFFYTPHDFWVLIPDRRESEEEYYKRFEEVETHGYYLIGGDTEFDKDFKRKYQNSFMEVDLDPSTPLKRNRHITVIEDYIVTTELTTGTAREIDELYEKCGSVEELVQNMQKILDTPQKLKIKLENNSQKAKKLRKKMSKNFFIPSELKQIFDLF